MSEVEYFSWKGEKALWTEQIAWTKLRGPEKMRLLGGSKELQGFQKGSPAARGRAAERGSEGQAAGDLQPLVSC